MVWYSHLFQNFPQCIVIHTVKGFGIVNKAEIDVFVELSCFFYNPAYVGNWMSGSSAFSKTSLNIWKFTVHILLKPGLEKFSITLLMCEIIAIVRSFELEEAQHLNDIKCSKIHTTVIPEGEEKEKSSEKNI